MHFVLEHADKSYLQFLICALLIDADAVNASLSLPPPTQQCVGSWLPCQAQSLQGPVALAAKAPCKVPRGHAQQQNSDSSSEVSTYDVFANTLYSAKSERHH